MTILSTKIAEAKTNGIPRIDLLKDPYDALEAIATLSPDTTKPLNTEQIGDGTRKTFSTNLEGVRLVKTEWARTGVELELIIETSGRKK